jgi:hypothetical protein
MKNIVFYQDAEAERNNREEHAMQQENSGASVLVVCFVDDSITLDHVLMDVSLSPSIIDTENFDISTDAEILEYLNGESYNQKPKKVCCIFIYSSCSL